MEFICAGNWKMNKSPADTATFIKTFRESAKPEEMARVALFPPAVSAQAMSESVKGTSIRWGGQNCYHAAAGAFTGETSALTLKDMGATLCLVGHSERRHVFAEPDEMLAKKVQFLQTIGMIPVLCVGETLDDRRWNRTQEVVIRQAKLGLQLANPEHPIWIAYEPVWAIGTGEVATPMQVEEAHSMIRTFLKEWSSSASDKTPILYGGSVKPENVEALAGLSNVNGFLVGGASLDPKEFLAIVRGSVEVRGA